MSFTNNLAVVTLLLLLHASAHAQSATRERLCWKDPSLQRCSTILLTDFAYHRPLVASQRSLVIRNPQTGAIEDERAVAGITGAAVLELGLLGVRSHTLAIGPSIQLGISGSGEQLRAGVRARTQPSARVAYDGRVSFLHARVGQSDISSDGALPAGSGVSIEARAVFANAITLGLGYDNVSWPDYSEGSRYSYRSGGRASALSVIVGASGDEGLIAAGAAVVVAAFAVLMAIVITPCAAPSVPLEIGPVQLGGGSAAACAPPPTEPYRGR